MTYNKDGGTAFPRLAHDVTDLHGNDITGGMSLRDYFAGQALPSILQRVWADLKAHGGKVDNVYAIASLAAYEMADELIAVREAQS